MTASAHVLEIGQSTIGIIVPEDHLQVRFFAAGAPYDRLDGQVFQGEREVLAAAKALLPRRTRGERRLTR